MENGRYVFCTALGAGMSFILELLGGYDKLLEALIILMSVDFLTGVIAAAAFKKSKKTKNGGLASSAMFKGFMQKCLGFGMVIVACVLDELTGKDSFVRNTVIIALCIRETLSFIENATLMGYKPPKALGRALEILNQKPEEDA